MGIFLIPFPAILRPTFPISRLKKWQIPRPENPCWPLPGNAFGLLIFMFEEIQCIFGWKRTELLFVVHVKSNYVESYDSQYRLSSKVDAPTSIVIGGWGEIKGRSIPSITSGNVRDRFLSLPKIDLYLLHDLTTSLGFDILSRDSCHSLCHYVNYRCLKRKVIYNKWENITRFRLLTVP